VLSIWKLRVGAEDYYLSQVADGLDDYYSGHGEAPGTWCGFGSIGLGLAGDVHGADLKAILAGLAPGTGLTPNASQLQHQRRRVPGFDLTFSAPKSDRRLRRARHPRHHRRDHPHPHRRPQPPLPRHRRPHRRTPTPLRTKKNETSRTLNAGSAVSDVLRHHMSPSAVWN
jgi:hypothetical protein